MRLVVDLGDAGAAEAFEGLLPAPVRAVLDGLVAELGADDLLLVVPGPAPGRPDPVVLRDVLASSVPAHRVVTAPEPGDHDPGAARASRHALVAALCPDAVVALVARPDVSDLARVAGVPTAVVVCGGHAATAPAEDGPDLVLSVAARVDREVPTAVRAWAAALPPVPAGPVRPSLALVSAWPPARSGVADYAAFTAPYLSALYDVTVVTDEQEAVTAGLPRETRAEFAQNWWRYDRVVYHLGNSVFHSADLGLLARAPGVVVLHDAVLTGALRGTGDGLGHPRGPDGLLADAGPTPPPGAPDLRGVRAALAPALGVVVHSQHAATLLREAGVTTNPVAVTRLATPAREPRGPAPADTDDRPVLAHFGFVNPYKGAGLLVAAAGALLARGAPCRVVFVGEFTGGGLLAETRRLAERLGVDMTVTGFVDEPRWESWLARSACAVQLREQSHGESSAALGELLARGVPVVCTDIGSFGELPEGVVRHVPPGVAPERLADVLEPLLTPETGRELAAAATRFARIDCAPEVWAGAVAAAVEQADAGSLAVRWAEESARLSAPAGAATVGVPDAFALRGRTGLGHAAWVTDVSVYANTAFFTGIQRVAARLHQELDTVLPRRGAGLSPARITEGLDDKPHREIARDPMSWRPAVPLDEAEWLLCIDLNVRLARHREQLMAARSRGLRVAVVVHDLMPVLHPEWFPRESGGGGFAGWLRTMLDVADLVVANSDATADDVRGHVEKHAPRRADALALATVPWGWDFDGEASIAPLGAGPREADHFLVVGTIEPRKGHRQVLAAFEALWAAGSPARLTVVGRRGWMVDDLVARMTELERTEPRFRWREDADDAELHRLYAACTAVVMPSHGEGFGLPVVEAALRGAPVVVRDIPVLREVAGDDAIYFSASGGDLERVVASTLARAARGSLPVRRTADLRRWSAVASDLADVLREDVPVTATWRPWDRRWH